MSTLKRVIHTVHRRSLWQVLAIVASSWVVLQVVDTVVERGVAPEWVFTASLFLLLVGLPIVLATAFVQEGHPGTAGSGTAEASPEDVADRATGSHVSAGAAETSDHAATAASDRLGRAASEGAAEAPTAPTTPQPRVEAAQARLETILAERG